MSPPTRNTPSLQIAELAITNFRTFRERTVIRFRDSEGSPVDAVATFHGDNGSGKSNALAALDLFFAAYPNAIRQADNFLYIPWDEGYVTSLGLPPLIFRSHDRSTVGAEPTVLEVVFADERLGTRRVLFIPSGHSVRVEASLSPAENRDQLVTWLSAPMGIGSRPLVTLNARRQPAWLSRQTSIPEDTDEPLSPLLWHLFLLSRSKQAEQRERWRAFVELLNRFPPFAKKEITVDRPVDRNGADLFFEERRRSVLSLGDLSSGERQIVALCTTLFTADAPLVALEEPEISLDSTNQRNFQEALSDQVAKGLFDQILIESHVPSFDGPRVIRFKKRPDGTTEVERARAAPPMSEELEKAARAQGATQRWVTADGFTQLPERMREELTVGQGKHVWFLPGEHHWEAWPEDDLESLFGPGEEEQE